MHKAKYLGARFSAEEIAGLEQHMAQRINRGEKAARAEMIREAVRKMFPARAEESQEA